MSPKYVGSFHSIRDDGFCCRVHVWVMNDAMMGGVESIYVGNSLILPAADGPLFGRNCDTRLRKEAWRFAELASQDMIIDDGDDAVIESYPDHVVSKDVRHGH